MFEKKIHIWKKKWIEMCRWCPSIITRKKVQYYILLDIMSPTTIIGVLHAKLVTIVTLVLAPYLLFNQCLGPF